jgi:putative ABC transport system ATP-binding protein
MISLDDPNQPNPAGPVSAVASPALEHQVKAPILETIGISKVYRIGHEMVSPVSDVSLQIGYGDFAVIFGPSGAGKSTLLNILMGLEKPDLGEVFLKGSSLYEYGEEDRTIIRRKKISYLPNAQYWLEDMNITDNVALPLILLGVSQKDARVRARQWIEHVGLGDRMNHRPDELSSGQQQKAALARALIKEPWLIFADEPTAHLDTKSIEEVTKILLDAGQRYGITIIMVTHDLDFLKLSKKWFLMRDGRLWDIKDRHNPFTDVQEALQFVQNNPDGRAREGVPQ